MPSQESSVEEPHETEILDSSVEVEPGVRIEGSETPRIGGIKGGGLLPHHKSIDFHTDIWSNLGPDSAMKLRDLIITEIVSHTFGDRDNAWSLFSEHRLIKDTNILGPLKNDFIECRTAAHNTLKEFIDTSHKIYNNNSANAIVTTKHPVAKFCKEQKESIMLIAGKKNQLLQAISQEVSTMLKKAILEVTVKQKKSIVSRIQEGKTFDFLAHISYAYENHDSESRINEVTASGHLGQCAYELIVRLNPALQLPSQDISFLVGKTGTTE